MIKILAAIASILILVNTPLTSSAGEEGNALLDREVSADFSPLPANAALLRVAQSAGLPAVSIKLSSFPGAAEVWLKVSAQHRKLGEVLDGLAAQYRGRWHYIVQGNQIIFDRPMPADRLKALLKSISDGANVLTDAREVVASGDLSARRELLLLLATDNPKRNRDILLAVREGLTMTYLSADVLADDAVRAAFAAFWRRATDRTVFDCYLAGILGCSDTIPDLRKIVSDPDAALPRLAADPALVLLRNQYRTAAALSLGLLKDKSSYDPVARYWTTSDPFSKPPLLIALASFGDRGALDLLKPYWQTGDGNWCMDEAVYTSARMLDPGATRILFQSQIESYDKAFPVLHNNWGWAKQPSDETLELMLDGLDRVAENHDKPWKVRFAIRSIFDGCAYLPPAKVTAAVNAQLARAQSVEAQFALHLLLARMGNTDAWQKALQYYRANRKSCPCECLGQILQSSATSEWLKPLRDEARGPQHDAAIEILASIDDPEINALLLSLYDTASKAAQAVIRDSMASSIDAQAHPFLKRLLNENNPDLIAFGRGMTEAYKADLFETARNTTNLAVRQKLLNTLFYYDFEGALDLLKECDDNALLAAAVMRLYAPYHYRSVYSLDLVNHEADLLLKWSERKDPKVRLAALQAILRWAHDNGVYKLKFIDAAQKALNDDDRDIRETAQRVLSNYTVDYIGTSQGYNAWQTALHGESDDIETLREIYRRLGKKEETVEKPPEVKDF